MELFWNWTITLLVIVGVILFFIYGVRFILKVFNKAEQADRRRAIEKGMRQSIIDRGYEQKAANKILREFGESP